MKELAGLADLVVEEHKAVRTLLACEGPLSGKEEEMIAASLAAGISQIQMLYFPLVVECSRRPISVGQLSHGLHRCHRAHRADCLYCGDSD